MSNIENILLDMSNEMNKLAKENKEQISEATKIMEREKQKFMKEFPGKSCLAFDLVLCMLNVC